MFDELTNLADEVRLCFHAFSDFARQTHGDRIDPPARAVLEFLSKHDPSTVPSIARSRGVTRQHIQTIMNDLESDRLVAASPNPAHKRSLLFALTADGTALIESINQTEHAVVEPLRGVLDPDRLTAATEILAEIRTLLSELEATT